MFVYLLKGKICRILAKKIFCGQIYSKVLYFLLQAQNIANKVCFYKTFRTVF